MTPFLKRVEEIKAVKQTLKKRFIQIYKLSRTLRHFEGRVNNHENQNWISNGCCKDHLLSQGSWN